MPQANEKRKLLCPECEKEVELTANEEGEWEGKCPACRIDVGLLVERDRYNRAMDSFRKRREEETAPQNDKEKKRKKLFGA